MAQQFRRRRHSPLQWLRRVDRAAARMNPFLALVVIGLTILNMMFLALQLYRSPNHRLALHAVCPAAGTEASQTDTISQLH